MPVECCIDTQLGKYALDFLRIDTRPTFIVFVPDEFSATEKAVMLFANDALRGVERRGELPTGWVLSESFLRCGGGRCFPNSRWRFTAVAVGDSVIRGGIMVVTAEWGGDAWECEFNRLQREHERMQDEKISRRQVNETQPIQTNGSGCEEATTTDTQSTLQPAQPSPALTLTVTVPKPVLYQLSRTVMDWVREDSPLYNSQHYRNLRNVDWSKTKCGPYHTWPACLRVMANSIMTMPYPTTFYWGDRYTVLYNEGWRKIAQDKDPQLLGKDFGEGWPELRNFFIPLLNAAYYNGEVTIKEAEQLFVNRGDILEECYFNFSICAVIGADGTREGVLEQAFELTRHIVSTRRMATLQGMGELLSSVKDLDEDDFWKLLLDAFNDNPLDSPFLLIYRTDGEEISNTEPDTERDIYCFLEGNVGFPEDSVLAPKEGRIGVDCGYFSDEMKIAQETNNIVIKKLDIGSIQGGDKVVYRGFRDTPTLAAVIPIQATKTITQGFLILGLNPRRPYDEDYKMWVELLKKELATTAGKARLLKAEIIKAIGEESQKAAAIQAIELQTRLQRRTEELRHSELLFTRTAETIPVGLVLLDLKGELVFQNDAYDELTTLPMSDENECWRQIIYVEDRPRVFAVFDELLSSGSAAPIQWEGRVGFDPSGTQGWKYWVTCSIVAQTDTLENGKEQVTGYMMTLVDITSIKMNEEYQRQSSAQAVERRRQQENFIDIFSHELRNPFSATLQCADGILGALVEYQSKEGQELNVEEMIDSASTILVCVQHQMRIIDDVLTLSKLDSMVLSVVPVDVQIHESVSQAIKIFHSELQVKGISSKYLLEDSYNELKVDWVKADPCRFSQILMNLITNAIKFTSLQASKREIITRLGASLERPTHHGDVIYHDGGPLSQNMAHADWGSGERVYILVTVQDSGIGISEEWQKKLFQRFEQVPRTHVTYGGSGLGLFICRQLCRIQGGEIGVHSVEGRGSSFSFYIEARRLSSPGDTQGQDHPVQSNGRPSVFEGLETTSHCIGGPGQLAPKSFRVPRPLEADKSTREQVSYNILIVEDNLINQEVLRRQLRKEGCVTHVAGNGDEALKIITESGFVKEGGIGIDIVLMDMEMPVMDGITATSKIREMERLGKIKKHVPIMGISANARPEQVAKMTEAGMDDAVSKPFRIVDLLVRFDGLLSKLATES